MRDLRYETDDAPGMFVGPKPPELAERAPIPVIPEAAAMRRLIGRLVQLSGLTHEEIGHRMGTTQQAVSLTLGKTSARVSLAWVTRLAVACGGRVLVELPPRPR